MTRKQGLYPMVNSLIARAKTAISVVKKKKSGTSEWFHRFHPKKHGEGTGTFIILGKFVQFLNLNFVVILGGIPY